MEDPNTPLMWYSYVVGVAGLMVATWWLFRRHSELAQFMTATVAAWLLTPIALTPEIPEYAPAFFVLVLDGLFTEQPVTRVLWPMAFVWVAALILSLLIRLAWNKFRNPVSTAKATAVERPAHTTKQKKLEPQKLEPQI